MPGSDQAQLGSQSPSCAAGNTHSGLCSMSAWLPVAVLGAAGNDETEGKTETERALFVVLCKGMLQNTGLVTVACNVTATAMTRPNKACRTVGSAHSQRMCPTY